MLTPAQVGGLLELLADRYGIATGAEISMELDPAGFDRERLAGYLAAGVNRVSLGGQSFDDDVLASLGRRHRRRDLEEAIGWMRQAHHRGALRSWSLDLIQGLPGESPARWRDQLERATAAEAPHLAIYDLIVEPGTVFARRQDSGTLRLPDPDLGADLMDLTWERLTAAGYGHYEISNYALPGHACRHNRVYWSGAGWWGFGMGATGAPAGRRLARPRTRAAYAAWVDQAERGGLGDLEGAAVADPLDRILVGLRLREGIDPLALLAACAPGRQRDLLEGLRNHLAPFRQRGLLLERGRRWRLSDPEGLALSNAVLREWLWWWQEAVPTPASSAGGCGSRRAAPPPPGACPPAAAG
jgi:oxygen-independent coproporphyrinogen-3 oxidase